MAGPRICTIPNCGKKRFGHGLCSAHYYRWRTHGDPLGGGTPYGEPMRYFLNEVLSYEGDECLIWPYARNGAGYGHMLLDGTTQLISRLVCAEIYGSAPTPKHEAAHSCGKGHEGCVAKRHLSWKTPVANAADRVAHGTNYRVELTSAQIIEIRALRGVLSQGKIGAKFGLHQTTIGRIQRGQRKGQSR
jgi:hypothetical protein